MTPVVQATNTGVAVRNSAEGRRRGPRTGQTGLPDLTVLRNGAVDEGIELGFSRDLDGDRVVHAFEREELDYWGLRLGRSLHSGFFGEQLTTAGINLNALLINQHVRIGAVLLEVSAPGRVSRDIGEELGQEGWEKIFTDRARPGLQLRVLTGGHVDPGARIALVGRPTHGVTMELAFRALAGNLDLARQVVAAHCLPDAEHGDLLARL